MPTLETIANPNAVIAFAGLLVLLTLGTAACWWGVCRRLVTGLRAARGIVEEHADGHAFAANYVAANQRLKSRLADLPGLGSAWNDLADRLTVEYEPDETAHLLSGQPPATWVNTAYFLRDHAIHWYRSLPNYLIGLGLCFTFVGVTLVIRNASFALAGNLSPDAQTGALRVLLHAASFKFITSLAGILCSIVYSILYRWQHHRLERETARLNSALERRLLVLRPAEILHRSLREQQCQSVWIEAIHNSLGEDATGKLADTLNHLRTEFSQTFALLTDRLTSLNEENLRNIVALATDGMSRALETHVQSLGAALDAIHGRLTGLLAEFSTLETSLAAVGADLSVVSREVSGNSQKFTAHLQSAAQDADAVREAFAGARDGVGRLADFPAAVDASVARWKDLAQQVQQTSAEHQNAAGKMQLASSSLQILWKQQSTHLAGADAALAATVAELEGVFGRYSASLQSYVGELDAHLARALGGLEHCVRQMNESPQQLRAAAEDVRRAIVEGMRGLENLPVERIATLSESLTWAAESLASSWQDVRRPPVDRSVPAAPPIPAAPANTTPLVP